MKSPVQAKPNANRRIIWIACGVVAAALIAIVAAVRLASKARTGDPREPSALTADRDGDGDGLPVLTGREAWRDDPNQDGWDTEAFSLRAKKQLDAIGKVLIRGEEPDAAGLAALIEKDFECAPLLPEELRTVFEDKFFTIDRLPSEDASPPAAKSFKGAGGFSEALQMAAAPFLDATGLRFEFKIFDVKRSPDEVRTRQYLSLFGQRKGRPLEQHATWEIRWKPGDESAPPRLRSIEVVDFEQSAGRQTTGVLYSDCTQSVLGGNEGYAGQFLRGMNHWFDRIQVQDTRYFSLLGNPGLAVGDVNGDGLDDLYVCQESALPNRLFIQSPDGSAREVSTEWGVDWLETSRSALLVDLDNDGDQDLAVAILGGLAIAENDGQGRFHLREVLSTDMDTMSLSAADYDRDGRLDLYVCVYYAKLALESTDSTPLPGAAAGFVVHDANNGGRNSLWRNEITAGDEWRFAEVTREVGLDSKNFRYSFAAAWDDFDNDGDLDLYVANDYGRDNFYRNDTIEGAGVRFAEVSESAGVEDSATGMSITCGDYDRDGWIDVLVSNMWSSAGQRISYQERFQKDATPEIKRRYQRLARGNTLLRNEGDGTFAARSAAAGIEFGRWAWGSHFVDLNNDGWEDLFVSNGYITTEDTGDL